MNHIIAAIENIEKEHNHAEIMNITSQLNDKASG